MTISSEEERRICCLACHWFFSISRLPDHERECPEKQRLDEELDPPGRNLR